MSDKKIIIIDYGMGNLKSVYNALKYLGYIGVITSREDDIINADAIILPGVGAFGEAINNLKKLSLVEPLNNAVLEKRKPFLGVCLGMHLMAEDSTEKGFNRGLGWLDGHVVTMKSSEGLKLPHVGWNDAEICDKEPLFKNIEQGAEFYFDHSYKLVCDKSIVLATCCYGSEVVSAIRKNNMFATQFHPEKSQVNGLKLLRNFLNYAESH